MSGQEEGERRWCDCGGRLAVGSEVLVRPCGCTSSSNRLAVVTRLFARRAWVDRPVDVARCAKDLARRRFWRNELHLRGCREVA
jgi:hypothetical protein